MGLRRARGVAFVIGMAAVAAASVHTEQPVASGISPEPMTPLKIRLAHGHPLATIYAMIDAKKDILPNYGREYIVERRRHDGLASEIAVLLARGEIDIGFTATDALVAANTTLGADLRIVADVAQDGVHGHNAIWFAVREDDPIREIGDLKGKAIATLGFGTWTDIAMRVGMKKAGLDPAKDAIVIRVSLPAMEASLRSRKVDMAQLVPPFYQIAMAKGGIRVLYTSSEAIGPTQTLMLAAPHEFLTKSPRRVQAFFDDYYRFLQYALNPRNRDEMIEIGARMQGDLPVETFGAWWNTKDDFYHDVEGLPNIDAVKREMSVVKEFGLIDSLVDIERRDFHELRVPCSSRSALDAMKWTPDGRAVVVAAGNSLGSLGWHLRQISTAGDQAQIDGLDSSKLDSTVALRRKEIGAVTSIDLSPDGSRIAVASRADRTIGLWMLAKVGAAQ